MFTMQARFPFLDESVIRTLLEIPLWEIANLDEPVGKGDKKILREVCISFVLILRGSYYIKFLFLPPFADSISVPMLKVAKLLGLQEASFLPKRAIQVHIYKHVLPSIEQL